MLKKMTACVLSLLLVLGAVGNAFAANKLAFNETIEIDPGLFLEMGNPDAWLANDSQRSLFVFFAQGALDDACPAEGAMSNWDSDQGYVVVKKDDTAICAWQSKNNVLYLVTHGYDGTKASKMQGVSLAEFKQTMIEQGYPTYEVSTGNVGDALSGVNEQVNKYIEGNLYETVRRVELSADNALLQFPEEFPGLVMDSHEILAACAIGVILNAISLCEDIGASGFSVSGLCLIGSREECTILCKISCQEDGPQEVLSLTISDALYIRKFRNAEIAGVKLLFRNHGEVIDFTEQELSAAAQLVQSALGI